MARKNNNKNGGSEDSLMGIVVVGVVAVGGYFAYKTLRGAKSGAENVIKNPFTTGADASQHLMKDFGQAVQDQLDFGFGSVDETVAKTFDSKSGGGLGEFVPDAPSVLGDASDKLTEVATDNPVENQFDNQSGGGFADGLSKTFNDLTPDVPTGLNLPGTGSVLSGSQDFASDVVSDTTSEVEQVWNENTPDIKKFNPFN